MNAVRNLSQCLSKVGSKCKSLVVGGLVVLPVAALACLWDTDTLKAEAAGKLDIVQIITGRFERWPDLYYQMRLKRVSDSLDDSKISDEAKLGLFDDAAVALERLKRSDDAIAVIERKRETLNRLDPKRTKFEEHWYRYFANAGTFWAHRWLSAGAKRTELDQMRHARQLIAKALEINPNAHFGRERYQLLTMDWIIDPFVYTEPPGPPKKEDTPLTADACDTLGESIIGLERRESRSTGSNSPSGSVKGLAGLVMLGSAWESVDIFEALAEISNESRDTAIARLAARRALELISEGRTSLIPGFKPRGTLEYSMNRNVRFIDREFDRLRLEADDWAKDREAFVLRRLKGGRHPDTSADFWDGYVDRPMPRLADIPLSQRVINWMEKDGFPYIAGTMCCLFPVGLTGLTWWWIRRRRRRKRGVV